MQRHEDHLSARVWHPWSPAEERVAPVAPVGDCCTPCLQARRRQAHRRLFLALAGAWAPRASPPATGLEVFWMMGQASQSSGMKLASRVKANDDLDYRYVVQVRQLYMAPIGHHEDVCVDRTCYTTGPAEGIYRRDPSASAWSLTNADGWSTLDGWSFNVNQRERDWLTEYMDKDIVGSVTRDNFLANLWEYYSNGFCVTFSRRRFNEMSQMVANTRG